MFSNLDDRHAALVDHFVNRSCSNPRSYQELSQLRRLFRPDFRRNLELLLNGALRRAGQPSVCEVQLGWIDKIPLADSAKLSNKTELGDAVLFAFDERRDPAGNLLNRTARAALLQAKIAKTLLQLDAPAVPVGGGSSTSRELCLLSQWPPFDLYQTSGHSLPCLKNVLVAPSASPPPQAWFIAAPGKALTTSQTAAWPSWWMAGEASHNSRCATSIGKLIVAFLAPGASALTVGAPFTRSAARPLSPSSTGSSNWSDLCNEILRILAAYNAPKQLFGSDQPRIYSVPFWMQYFVGSWPLGHAIMESQWLADRYNRLGIPPDPPDPPAEREDEGKGKGMIAVSVTVTRFGEDYRDGEGWSERG